MLEGLKRTLLGDASKSPEEKKLVQKLDFFILTYSCISFFFNYLDRGAFANAYVAGLKEDLNLGGSNYNVLLSMTTAGYVVGQIPHAIIIQKIPPRIWLPSMVIIWAALTMCSAACKTYAQLCAVRFLQGLIEASTYCGTHYIIGSWYKELEIAKRAAIFTASGQAGGMFAGVMMTAIHKTMNGHAGLPGWKWVFIIDGVITLPVAIMGFLTFPDVPENTRAPYLKPAEVKLALERLPPKREDGHNINPWSLTKRVFASPAFYILGAFSVVCGALEAFCVQNLLLLWLKYNAKDYSQSKITTYPLGVQAVGIISNLSASVYIDATNKRVPMGLLAAGLQLISAIMLLVPSLPNAGTFFAFYLAGTSYIVNPLLFGWANVILKRGGDDALRSIVLYWMNATSSIFYTFWGIALFPASDVPYWRNGAISMICVCVSMVSMLGMVKWLDKKTIQLEVEYIAGVEARLEKEMIVDVKDKEIELVRTGAVGSTTVPTEIVG